MLFFLERRELGLQGSDALSMSIAATRDLRSQTQTLSR